MKKTIRVIPALVLAFTLIFALSIPAFAAEGQTIRNVNETYKLVHGTELVAIYKAELYADGATAQDVYYVACRGLDFTELDPNQPRSYANAIKIGLSNENNSYVKKLSALVLEYVPQNSRLVLAGHSMGGMVLEQFIARKEIKDKYEILNTMSIGSPYILTSAAKEGRLIRMVDRLDPIPFLSIPLLANPYMGNVAQETSFQFPLVHFASYEKGECWSAYDALGYKNGNAYVVLKELVYE